MDQFFLMKKDKAKEVLGEEESKPSLQIAIWVFAAIHMGNIYKQTSLGTV